MPGDPPAHRYDDTPCHIFHPLSSSSSSALLCWLWSLPRAHVKNADGGAAAAAALPFLVSSRSCAPSGVFSRNPYTAAKQCDLYPARSFASVAASGRVKIIFVSLSLPLPRYVAD